MNRLTRLAHKLTAQFLALFRHSVLHVLHHDHIAVFLDIHETVNLRTIRHMLILFEMTDYPVYIRARLNRTTLALAGILKWHTNTVLTWWTPRPSERLILCTDQATLRDEASWKKVFSLHYDYSPRLQLMPGHFAMPYPMHPQIYTQYHDHLHLAQLRTTRRKFRLLFAGNYKWGYDGDIITALCGKVSRRVVVEHLKAHPAAKIIRNEADLAGLLDADWVDGLVVIDSDVRIDQKDWLSLLAQVDCFVCPPGILFPPSHNAIESLAVGTVPLINYADWFFPKLIDGREGLLFSTLNELDTQIALLVALSADEIAQFRMRAAQYYDDHMDYKGFMSRLLSTPEKMVHLHILNEIESVVRHSLGG